MEAVGAQRFPGAAFNGGPELRLGREADDAKLLPAGRRSPQQPPDFAALRITRHPVHPHLDRIIELRNDLTAYDACYVALSETLRMPLLTQDLKLSRAASEDW